MYRYQGEQQMLRADMAMTETIGFSRRLSEHLACARHVRQFVVGCAVLVATLEVFPAIMSALFVIEAEFVENMGRDAILHSEQTE